MRSYQTLEMSPVLPGSQNPPKKLPHSYSVQNLSCSFSTITRFYPQRFLCCSILTEKEKENNFHAGIILLVQAVLFQAVPVEQKLERLWTLARSQGEIFPVSHVTCEDKQEKLGWDLSSPTSERASSLPSGNQYIPTSPGGCLKPPDPHCGSECGESHIINLLLPSTAGSRERRGRGA